MSYDNNHLQKVIDTATALQHANNDKAEAVAGLDDAQTAVDEATSLVEEYARQYDELIGKTTQSSRLRR